MKLLRTAILPFLLTFVLCISLAPSAYAFTDVGTWAIQPGDRIQVTVGADQKASFTYTPTRNMRCNIYQDCDQYMTLVHIAPFHMDSAQEHWGDDTPRKGIRFSMKAGVEYTMEVAMPAHFHGGTFTVYFDLVEYLPDNFFSSGASWDAIGNPDPDTPDPSPDSTEAQPTGIKLLSPPSTLYYFGGEDYGSRGPNGSYVFSPSNYNLYEGLSFEILYSDGSSETVLWNMLEWPEGTNYNAEGVVSFYKGKSLRVVPYFDDQFQFFPTFDSPGPVPFRVDYGGLFDSFTIELLPSDYPGSGAGIPELSGDAVVEFSNHAEFSPEALSKLGAEGGSLTLEQNNFILSLDSDALSAISQQAEEDEQIVFDVEIFGEEGLTEEQQDSMKGLHVTAAMDVNLLCGDRSIHQLGGTAVLRVPCDWEDGIEYEVYYLAGDASAQLIPSFRDGGVIAFETDHFSVYAVVRRESAQPDTSDQTTPTPEENIPATEQTPPSHPVAAVCAAVAAAAIVAAAIAVFLLRRKHKQ